MNVPTITMPPALAKEKLRAYRSELHHQADDVYRAAADGYKMLAEGIPLIDLNAAILAGGFFDIKFPRLAVARADRKVVRCDRRPANLSFSAGHNPHGDISSLRISVPVNLPGCNWSWKFTRVPMVPADVKAQLRAGRRSLQWRNYHILWEVEQWYDRNPIEPPVDPFLLKHVGGSLYAVLAQWDLTELERSVMRGLVS